MFYTNKLFVESLLLNLIHAKNKSIPSKRRSKDTIYGGDEDQ